MRRAVLLAGLLGTGSLAPLVAAVGTGLAPSAAGAPDRPSAAVSRYKTVEYRGVRVPVPADRPVYRLDRDPTRCVRYDRPAVYLGRPGPQPDCPAKLVGRADVLHLEPLGDPSARRRAAGLRVKADKLASHTVEPTVDHQVRVPLPEAGVVINGVYGDGPGALQDTLRATRLTTAWPAEPSTPTEPQTRSAQRRADETQDERKTKELVKAQSDKPVEEQAKKPVKKQAAKKQKVWAQGKAFDTCTAPSLRAMSAWRSSYGIANIYIGGAARGCAQPNLTASWVRRVRAMGYRLIPTYVGLQAPCGRYRQHFTAKNATAKGKAAAKDAVARAKALGIPAGKPIYFDIEAYDGRNASCRNAVLRFMHAWSRGMNNRNYAPGVYSSVSSGIRDLGLATGITKPKAIWFAHWDGQATVYDYPHLPATWWPPHRRIKQYRGGHRETHGGVTINVDSNLVDGRVY
ncbi:glycoside hydrolase domain-containing protein [Actinomadura hibisca]|uniref:glycoside hydrolase domain-containing protein n=1 Tax=Actinomadura hibisca TaxID=68565 RepID=UPI00083672E5|nr:glycoside hydrolase domain-containing protein [Actinomadura hibisca]